MLGGKAASFDSNVLSRSSCSVRVACFTEIVSFGSFDSHDASYYKFKRQGWRCSRLCLRLGILSGVLPHLQFELSPALSCLSTAGEFDLRSEEPQNCRTVCVKSYLRKF
jgi:hypothetical protein